MKRVPRMARTRPRKYIALNREDDAWVAGKLDGRKVSGDSRRTTVHRTWQRETGGLQEVQHCAFVVLRL